MKVSRSRIAVAAGCCALAIPAAALADSQDQINGSGVTSIGTEFSFSGQSNFNGTNPSGGAEFRNRAANTFRKGDIVCMKVSGNRALFGIKLVDPDPANPAAYRTFVIKDNGDPVSSGSGTRAVDQITQVSATNTAPTCAGAIPTNAGPVLQSGNIVIRDATAAS